LRGAQAPHASAGIDIADYMKTAVHEADTTATRSAQSVTHAPFNATGNRIRRDEAAEIRYGIRYRVSRRREMRTVRAMKKDISTGDAAQNAAPRSDPQQRRKDVMSLQLWRAQRAAEQRARRRC